MRRQELIGRITRHAQARYRERICADILQSSREAMADCLLAAKPKHFARLVKEKRTSIIPTGCCMFICSYGLVVSVLPRNAKRVGHIEVGASGSDPIT